MLDVPFGVIVTAQVPLVPDVNFPVSPVPTGVVAEHPEIEKALE